MSESEKLQKVLAKAGIGSRREMEKWIERGQIKVNGVVATIGDRVTAKDKIKVKNKLIKNPLQGFTKCRVIMYHKPVGQICTAQDPEGRKTVFDALPKLNNSRWIMVGRLDINTSGLLLFTNDGEFANQLMHPRYEIEREYAVRVVGDVTDDIINNLKKGVKLDDGMAAFDSIAFSGGEGTNSWYHVVLHEGRNREVRRLWESQGLQVSRLTRIRFGNLPLPKYLRRGAYKELEASAIQRLKHLIK